MLALGENLKMSTGKILPREGSNTRRCVKRDSEPNTLPPSYSGPGWSVLFTCSLPLCGQCYTAPTPSSLPLCGQCHTAPTPSSLSRVHCRCVASVTLLPHSAHCRCVASVTLLPHPAHCRCVASVTLLPHPAHCHVSTDAVWPVSHCSHTQLTVLPLPLCGQCYTAPTLSSLFYHCLCVASVTLLPHPAHCSTL